MYPLYRVLALNKVEIEDLFTYELYTWFILHSIIVIGKVGTLGATLSRHPHIGSIVLRKDLHRGRREHGDNR